MNVKGLAAAQKRVARTEKAWHDARDARDRLVVEAAEAGSTHTAIGLALGVTRGRVNQIIQRAKVVA
jgi:hypothetical protein